MKEPVKEFAEDECEDQNFISEDKVMVKHELDDVIGDDFAEDVKEYEPDENEAEYGLDNEVCDSRDFSDDEYEPDLPSDDLGQDSEDGDSPKKTQLKPKKARGRPPKRITDIKNLAKQRRVNPLRITFREWCVQLGCEEPGRLLSMFGFCCHCRF